jgi:SAM-dependent methyltransferase
MSFDEVAAHYDTYGVTYFRSIAARLAEHAELIPDSMVLDVGCGPGAVAFRAARASRHVTAMDLSPLMLARCRSMCGFLGLPVAVVQANAHRLPCRDQSVDRVLASMLVFLLTDPVAAWREWRRVLIPGGRVAFSWNVHEDPRWEPAIAAVDSYVDRGLGTLLRHPPFGSPSDVGYALSTAGYETAWTVLEPVNSRYSGPQHWWEASWSQAAGVAWSGIPEHQRRAARDDAFLLLDGLREPDGSLTRTTMIGYTVAG